MRIPTFTLVCGLAAASLLAACGEKGPKTVAFYVENPAERQTVVAACNNNPGKLKDDPDCVNANAAVLQGWIKPHLPPVTFARQASAAASK